MQNRNDAIPIQALEDVEYLSRSPNRVIILDTLTKGPYSHRDLAELTETSRTTLDRIVNELDGPLQIVLEPRPSFNIEHVEGYPVIPRTETIEYMRENYAQFQSALGMLDRMYEDLDLDVTYRETERVQP
jgi:hypothetical protein